MGALWPRCSSGVSCRGEIFDRFTGRRGDVGPGGTGRRGELAAWLAANLVPLRLARVLRAYLLCSMGLAVDPLGDPLFGPATVDGRRLVAGISPDRDTSCRSILGASLAGHSAVRGCSLRLAASFRIFSQHAPKTLLNTKNTTQQWYKHYSTKTKNKSASSTSAFQPRGANK